MKRFIARKKIKIPRYKVILSKIIIFMLILFSLNIIVNIYIDLFLSNNMIKIIKVNSFGNIIDKYSFNSNLLYKNSYGFNIYLDKKVSSDNSNITDLVIDTKPLVYIYNTFQTDKYTNNYYSSYNINPVITQASLILQEYLKKEGISSLVELSSVAKVLKENNIDYSLSYRGSRILLNNAKNENNSLKYFIDIQLSDNDYDNTTCMIDDIAYAKVMWVVGTDNTNYLKNEKIVNKLDNDLKKFNSCISKGVSKWGGAGYHGVYNQDFDENVMLLQVGGRKNTIAEVNRTLKIVAGTLAKYIKGEI